MRAPFDCLRVVERRYWLLTLALHDTTADARTPFLLGGLGVFVFAIGQLSEVLREAFTDEARETVKKYTRHLLASVVIGALVTVLFGSSSAAIILTIVLINAGALDVRNAIGIVLGANVGTTVSSQPIALDVTSYSSSRS